MELNELALQPAEVDGHWFKGEEGLRDRARRVLPGVELLVASASNPDYKLAMAGALRAATNKRLRHGGTRQDVLPSTDEEMETRVQAAARHLLRDWAGITEDGKPLPCTLANRLKLLRLPDMLEQVEGMGADGAAFAEAELGNSASSPEDSSG